MKQNNIPVLDRQVSKKNSYTKENYRKGYKIPIVSDTMFATMINNYSRRQYASLIISEVLEVDYNEVYNTIEFVKNKLDKEKANEKGREVDFVVKIKGEIIGIEMNNNYSKSSYERNISYTMDLYKSEMKRGTEYNYKKVTQININNFTLGNNNKTKEEYLLKNEDDEILTDKIKIVMVTLPNIKKKYYNNNELSRLEKLMLVFNENDEDKLLSLSKGDRIMVRRFGYNCIVGD